MRHAIGWMMLACAAAGPAPLQGAPPSNVCPVTAAELRGAPGGQVANHGDGAGLVTTVYSPVVFKPGGPGWEALRRLREGASAAN